MKRILIVSIAVLALTLVLTACATKTANNKSVKETTEETTEETTASLETVETNMETTQEVTEEATEEIVEEIPVVLTVTEPAIEPPVETTPVETTPTEGSAPYVLSDYERYVAECMVMGEIGAESYEGQMLVAQCILNACLKEGIPPSRVRVEYGYYGWHNSPSESVKNAVSAVFDHGEVVVNEPILYFYAPALCTSSWHESQVFVIEEGHTRFFKEWD